MKCDERGGILFRRKECSGVPYRIADAIEQRTDKYEENQNRKNFHFIALPDVQWPLRFSYYRSGRGLEEEKQHLRQPVQPCAGNPFQK